MSPNQSQSTGQERLAWRVGEFCSAVGISRASFYKAVNDGRIRTTVIAGRRLIPETERRRLLEDDSKMSPIRESYFQRKKAERCRHVAEAAIKT